MQYAPMIPSLIDQDMYKFSMGQAILHQFPGHTSKWAFKCRNKNVYFTPEMVQEIREQIQHYCTLRFKPDELAFLSRIKWMKPDYIAYLRIWHPMFEDFVIGTDDPCGLTIEFEGSWVNVSPYETPVLAIVNETYFRMAHNYEELLISFDEKLDDKFDKLKYGKWYIGNFSDFGFRRRLSFEAQEHMIRKFAHLNDTMHCPSRFIGTSDVYFAYKHGLLPTGTQAHEWTMGAGQGNRMYEPSYSNHFAMEAWVREYQTMNGTALTDTIGTDTFLLDFDLAFANLFAGVRHDSGDPFVWGDKFIKHYERLGIDPKTKTLLFSDSLNFERATEIFEYFRGKVMFGAGIGTYLTNDTCVDPLNIVVKPIEFNGLPVAKISDSPGKGMCRDDEYVPYLQRCIDWRLKHAA